MPIPSMRAKLSIRNSASGSPASAAATRSGPRHRAPLGRGGGRACCRAGPRQLGGVALERLAASSSASRQPWFGQLPGHGGPSGSTACGRARRPGRGAAEGAAVDHDAAADARAEGEHHELALAHDAAPRRARRSWRRCPRPRERRSGGRARPAARRRSSGMFTLVTTVPVAKSICEGTPTPMASGSPGLADHLPDRVLHAVEQRVGARQRPWGARPCGSRRALDGARRRPWCLLRQLPGPLPNSYLRELGLQAWRIRPCSYDVSGPCTTGTGRGAPRARPRA